MGLLFLVINRIDALAVPVLIVPSDLRFDGGDGEPEMRLRRVEWTR